MRRLPARIGFVATRRHLLIPRRCGCRPLSPPAGDSSDRRRRLRARDCVVRAATRHGQALAAWRDDGFVWFLLGRLILRS